MAPSFFIIGNDLLNGVACDVRAAVVNINGGAWINGGSCDWRHYVEVFGDSSMGSLAMPLSLSWQCGHVIEAVAKAATSGDTTVGTKETCFATSFNAKNKLCCMWSLRASCMAALVMGPRASSAAVCEMDAYALCVSLKLRM